MLVDGDVIALESNERAPCKCHSASDLSRCLVAGQVRSDVLASPSLKCTLCVAMLLALLTHVSRISIRQAHCVGCASSSTRRLVRDSCARRWLLLAVDVYVGGGGIVCIRDVVICVSMCMIVNISRCRCWRSRGGTRTGSSSSSVPARLRLGALW
jgi:hypothetical protein